MRRAVNLLIVITIIILLAGCRTADDIEQPDRNSEQTTETTEVVISSAAPSVSETQQNEDPVRAVMAYDTLYLDTGYASGVWGRCGNLDGAIENVIDRDEIPDENGEANFDANGWQVGFEANTIEVYVDGEFRIFAAEGSAQAQEGYVPSSVLQFLGTVVRVSSDGDIVVEAMADPAEMFGNCIVSGNRYVMSAQSYAPGIYTDEPIVGSVVTVICKNDIDTDTAPARINYVYSISPIGSDVCQPA
ncbi:MAG: hypothetical protein IJ757_09165 [Clostridiales bacterium]|nr:hypothetical protein [Clostridiales bacterium]